MALVIPLFFTFNAAGVGTTTQLGVIEVTACIQSLVFPNAISTYFSTPLRQRLFSFFSNVGVILVPLITADITLGARVLFVDRIIAGAQRLAGSSNILTGN